MKTALNIFAAIFLFLGMSFCIGAVAIIFDGATGMTPWYLGMGGTAFLWLMCWAMIRVGTFLVERSDKN